MSLEGLYIDSHEAIRGALAFRHPLLPFKLQDYRRIYFLNCLANVMSKRLLEVGKFGLRVRLLSDWQAPSKRTFSTCLGKTPAMALTIVNFVRLIRIIDKQQRIKKWTATVFAYC